MTTKIRVEVPPGAEYRARITSNQGDDIVVGAGMSLDLCVYGDKEVTIKEEYITFDRPRES